MKPFQFCSYMIDFSFCFTLKIRFHSFIFNPWINLSRTKMFSIFRFGTGWVGNGIGNASPTQIRKKYMKMKSHPRVFWATISKTEMCVKKQDYFLWQLMVHHGGPLIAMHRSRKGGNQVRRWHVSAVAHFKLCSQQQCAPK